MIPSTSLLIAFGLSLVGSLSITLSDVPHSRFWRGLARVYTWSNTLILVFLLAQLILLYIDVVQFSNPGNLEHIQFRRKLRSEVPWLTAMAGFSLWASITYERKLARSSRIRCTWCAEYVLPEADICRYCHRYPKAIVTSNLNHR